MHQENSRRLVRSAVVYGDRSTIAAHCLVLCSIPLDLASRLWMLLPSHYSSNCFHTLRTHCPPVIFFNCRRFGVSICIIVFSGDGALSFVWGCFIRITGYVESVYVRQYIYFNSRRRCLVQKKWRAFFPGMYHLPRGYFVLSPFFFFRYVLTAIHVIL